MDNVSGQNGQQSAANPYDAYKETEIWRQVEKAIVDLAANNDIIEMTKRENIVGYICKCAQPAIPETHI